MLNNVSGVVMSNEEDKPTSPTVFMQRIEEGASIEEAREDADLVAEYVANNTIDGKLRIFWCKFKNWIFSVLAAMATGIGLALDELIIEMIKSL